MSKHDDYQHLLHADPEALAFAKTAKKKGVWKTILCAVALGGFVSFHWPRLHSPSPPPPEHAHAEGITQAELSHGLELCAANQQRPLTDYSFASRRLAGRNRAADCTVFRNATVIQGDGHITHGLSLVIQDGIITYVGGGDASTEALSSSCPEASTVVDLHGRYFSPGLIDLHSHVGLRQQPQLWANEDVTESSVPVSPWARAVDGFKPGDEGIRIVASGGTTTSLVLTGAMNLISGEGMVIKHRHTTSVWEQQIDSTSGGRSPKPRRHLKMACGENIKGQFKNRPTGPVSRQGESGLVRFAFETARHLMQQQDTWCENAAAAAGAARRMAVPYPSSIHDQTLVDVMRGDLYVHVHCYQPQDVFAEFDHADEFGFNITALHHITQAHEMLDEIKKRGTVLATFSDEGGFKNENYHYSWYMLKLAAAAGIPIALTTDHPAKHGQFLAYEAQVAHNFELSEALSLASLLSVPAATIGLDNRIGWLRPGYDADVVVWDSHPLALGATPLEVRIDGKIIVRASDALWAKSLQLPQALAPAPASRVQKVPDSDGYSSSDSKTCVKGQKDLVLRGIRESFLQDLAWPPTPATFSRNHINTRTTSNGTVVVIRGGVVQCVGDASCAAQAAEAMEQGIPVMDLENGHLLPGIAIVTRSHGLTEMVEEPTTQDGFLPGNDVKHVVTAADGLQFGDQHLEFDHRRGITTIITAPSSKGFLHGISSAFRPGAAHALDAGAIINRAVGLQVGLGEDGKTASFPTISSQIDQLRTLLTAAESPHPVYALVANGTLPLVVRTDNKDIIAKTLTLQKLELPALRPIIFGGGEAYLLADELAAAGVPVVLAPFQCSQLTWEVRNCRAGPPLTDDRGANILLDAGVTVGLGNWDHRDRWVPNALWEAAWLLRGRGVGDTEADLDTGLDAERRAAIAMVTSNMRQIFGLPVQDAAEFVVYEGDPLEYGASVALIVEQGVIQRCWPDVM